MHDNYTIMTRSDHEQVLFAACASLLVREFSTHAKHSGIAEIKTVLGGFVIRRFLGVWTLVVKTLGLVRDLRSQMRRSLISTVSCRCIWPLAGQRGPVGSRRVLLRKPLHETIP